MTRRDSARNFVPPPLLYAAGLALGLALDGRFDGGFSAAPTMARWIALAPILAGAALIAAGLGWFWREGTRAEPWAPASALVTRGIYGWTRNAMYLGLSVLYGGLALLFWSPIAGALLIPLVAIMNFVIIPREEAYLERRFGADYSAYRGTVRRWL